MGALRHAWTARYVLRRWEASTSGSPRNAARQAGLDRPTARHTRRWAQRPQGQPGHRSSRLMTARLLNQLPVWAPDPAIRHNILVDNPIRLWILSRFHVPAGRR